MKRVQVFGPGCAKCEETAKVVKEAVAESGVEAEVVKVTDFQEIAMAGVFSTPAVAVDGQIKVVGRVPSRQDVVGWLKA